MAANIFLLSFSGLGRCKNLTIYGAAGYAKDFCVFLHVNSDVGQERGDSWRVRVSVREFIWFLADMVCFDCGPLCDGMVLSLFLQPQGFLPFPAPVPQKITTEEIGSPSGGTGPHNIRLVWGCGVLLNQLTVRS